MRWGKKSDSWTPMAKWGIKHISGPHAGNQQEDHCINPQIQGMMNFTFFVKASMGFEPEISLNMNSSHLQYDTLPDN